MFVISSVLAEGDPVTTVVVSSFQNRNLSVLRGRLLHRDRKPFVPLVLAFKLLFYLILEKKSLAKQVQNAIVILCGIKMRPRVRLGSQSK